MKLSILLAIALSGCAPWPYARPVYKPTRLACTPECHDVPITQCRVDLNDCEGWQYWGKPLEECQAEVLRRDTDCLPEDRP